MSNDEHETLALSGCRPLEHLQVAIRVPERCNRAAADDLMDANRFSRPVIDMVHLRQLHEHGLAVAQVELHLRPAADDLLGWNPVYPLHPRTHEFDATAGDDEGLEAAAAHVGE